MKLLIALILGVLSIPVFQSDSQDELVYYPLDHGNAAFLKVTGKDLYLFNTGHESDRYDLYHQLEEWKGYRLRGIIITQQNTHNCGNIDFLINTYDVEQLIVPGSLNESCAVDHQDVKQVNLKQHPVTQITEDYTVRYEASYNGDGGNVELKRGRFTAYWYETSAVADRNERVTFVYLPSYIYEEDLSIEFLDRLDPRVAVIQEKAKMKQMRLLNEILSKEWIEAFFLTKNLSVHVEVGDGPYRIFLVRR